MLSSRALEIVSRFSRGCSTEETLENIDEYVNEYNELYYDAKSSSEFKRLTDAIFK